MSAHNAPDDGVDDERLSADCVAVYVVWCPDEDGTFLHSIWATQEGADRKAEELRFGAWVTAEKVDR